MIAKAKPPKPLFELGQQVATPGALEALAESGEHPFKFVARHVTGDWGACDAHDAQANEDALADGSRIFSVYHTTAGVKLWVITEAKDDSERRGSTCILLPEEC